MDYKKMTTESLSDWIFNRSGYKVNKQDCKSRIENLCVKYARGEFEINGVSRNVSSRNTSIAFWVGFMCGMMVMLIAAYFAFL